MGGLAKLSCKSKRAAASSLALGLSCAAPAAQAGPPALPSGGVVVAGSASILQSGPSATVIVQQSKNAIINWQDFSVGAGAGVTFQQPGSSSLTLNRVTGSQASAVNGSLLANGQVWLINRNGVLFGQGSQINVGGLIATTSDMKDDDFLSGHYAFANASANPDAAVVNQGSIKAATGGSVLLSAGRVSNEGLIQARLGHVVLGGADAFSVSFDGDNLLQYEITAPVSQADSQGARSLVSNSGVISAQGGSVLMTARAARGVVDNVINTTGLIQARSASVQNGEVVLDAGEDGSVAVSGTIDTSGQNSGESGGTIAVSGNAVTVLDGAKLDASGDAGGGTISIGGKSQQNAVAQSVRIGKAVIAADAIAGGKGGTVTIVSQGMADVAASISAKGVAGGGMVETSGGDLNVADTRIDTSASAGANGQWLLDPLNVAIDAALASNIIGNLAGTNVSITASNDINVNAPVVYNSGNSLSLLAGHNLTVNANVQNIGAGNILAVAGWDGVTAAASIFKTSGAYGGNGGSILIGGGAAGGGVALGSSAGSTTVAARDLTLSALHGNAQIGYGGTDIVPLVAKGDIAIVLNGNLTLQGGNQVGRYAQIGNGGLAVKGNLSGNISIAAQGAVSVTGGNLIQGYAQIGNGGALSAVTNAGSVQLTSGGNVILSGGAFLTAGAAGDSLVVAAAGDFVNQAGGTALGVTGGGRWLVFLASPANNTPGGLIASPFYNRPFDFSTNSYGPVTGAGNRFVYALAPTITVTANDIAKIYGTANPALTATISGGLPGDAAAGVFAGAPALSTAATAHSGVGNYAITAGPGSVSSDFNYGFQFVNGTLHIDPATLTASLTGLVQKTYDGTVFAPLTTANYQLSGVLPGDSVSLNNPAIGSYNSKDVGSPKLVSVGSLALSGPDSANYLLSSANVSAAIGTISPAALLASLTGTVQKVYDGTTAAVLTPASYQLSGVYAGDSVTLNSPVAGSYNSKDVGNSKLVSVGGLALSGLDSGNYLLSSANVSAAIGTITPAALLASLTGTVQKVYDGTASAVLTPANYQLSGVYAGDSVTLNSPAVGSYNDKNVANAKTVSAGGLTLSGPDSGNYLLSLANVSAAIGTITPAALLASLTGSVQKVYDGTAAAALTPANYQLSGVLAGDSVTLGGPAAGRYDNKNVGNAKTVSAGGLTLSGPDSGNYLLSSAGASGAIGTITPVTLSASLTGTVQKIFDGTTVATLAPANYDLSGAIAGDDVALNDPVVGGYDSKYLGTGKTVTVGGLALLGSDGGNYVLASPNVSSAIGIISASLITNAIGNSYTSGTGGPSGPGSPPAGGPGAASDATSDTGGVGNESSDNTAFEIGKSLSGSAQHSSSVVLDGLLRQFSATSGAANPHGVPPYGQVYSSWGNEAFWQ